MNGETECQSPDVPIQSYNSEFGLHITKADRVGNAAYTVHLAVWEIGVETSESVYWHRCTRELALCAGLSTALGD